MTFAVIWHWHEDPRGMFELYFICGLNRAAAVPAKPKSVTDSLNHIPTHLTHEMNVQPHSGRDKFPHNIQIEYAGINIVRAP